MMTVDGRMIFAAVATFRIVVHRLQQLQGAGAEGSSPKAEAAVILGST